jgi:hypothetical protein
MVGIVDPAWGAVRWLFPRFSLMRADKRKNPHERKHYIVRVQVGGRSRVL